MKISDKLGEIRRRYKNINSYKFAYNQTGELTKKENKILCYYLLYNREQGYWIFKFIWYGRAKRIESWKNFLQDETDKGARWILQNKILSGSSWAEKRRQIDGADWNYKDLICWTWPKKIDDYRKRDRRYHG